MINKAVITAAGRGTRFLPVVKAYPKELIPILSRPNIQYLIEEAIGAGITEIAIVHRPGDNAIEKYFTPDIELENYLKQNNKLDYLSSLEKIWSQSKLTFVPQGEELPYGNASPILAAEKFIGSDDFVYMFGDDMTVETNTGEYLARMINTFNKYRVAMVVSVKDVGISEISRFGCAQYMDDPNYPNRISAIIEKPKAEEAPSTFAQGGRYIVSNKIFSSLKIQKTGSGNELWFADAQNALAKTDIVVTEAYTPSNDWMTTGDPLRWLKANITVALNTPEFKEDLKEFIKPFVTS